MAPSWIASLADSQPAYAVRRMTSASEQWARAARRTSSPSPSGMRRSVTMTSKASSVRALTATPTPSASVTRWLRFRSSSARVVRAEASSSTTRIAANSRPRAERQHNGEPRALAGCRLDVDPPPMRGDDAPGDGEPEAGAAPLPGVEGLEHPPALLDRNPAAGVGDRDRHRAAPAGDRDVEAPGPLHRLDPVQRDVPQHLGDLVGVEAERGHRGIDPHRELHPLGATRILPDQGRDVIDDRPDVGLEGLGLAGAGEDEKVREDPVEPPCLLLDRAQ